MAGCPASMGRYRLERELGRGSMGVVYQAFDPVVERTVAIKTIVLDAQNPAELIDRLKREAKSVGQLEHSNIVTLFDAAEVEGMFYLVMQYIAGETLRDWLVRRRRLELVEIRDLFRQICSGLHYAHERGVIHRDVKPANIMITPEGQVKLADFGIAKLSGGTTLTRGLVIGTPSYMSPEQALGRPLDHRSDVFSLGSILYELVTGERPFRADTATTIMYKIIHEPPVLPISLRPDLDPEVQSIILKALAKEPAARFQSCLELFDTLNGCAETTALRNGEGQHSLQGWWTAMKARSLLRYGAPTLAFSMITTLAVLGVKHRHAPNRTLAGESATVARPASLAPTSPVTTGGPQPASATTTQDIGHSGVDTGQFATSDAKPSVTRTEPVEHRRAMASPPADPRPPATNATPELRARRRSKTTPAASSPAAPLIEPETFNGWLVKGDLELVENHYADALFAYSKAYRLNPYSRLARHKLYDVLMLLGRPKEAERYR